MVAEPGRPDENAQHASIWARLSEAVDLGGYRPCLREGNNWREFTSTQGEPYVIVQNPGAATYLRLSAEDFYIFRLMDGSYSIQELVVAYMMQFRRFAPQPVMQLVEDLRYNEMLVDAPRYTYERVWLLAHRPSPRAISSRISGYLLNRQFPITGIDRGLERAYRAGVWPLFSRPGLILLAAIAFSGVPLLLWQLFAERAFLGFGTTIRSSAPVFFLSLVAIAMGHELAHAFTVKSYGRTVRSGGLCVFYGFPGAFVDTQDMWMERRGARIAASWAGPYSGFILAGLAGIAITFAPAAPWAPSARLFGLAAIVANAFQLMPLIRLDGYYILMDWLEIPNLRARALNFLRYDFLPKLRRRQSLSRDERIFAIFGVLAAGYTLLATLLVSYFFWTHARQAVIVALRVPNLQSLLGLALGAILLAPLALGMCFGFLGIGQTLLRTAGRATGAARDHWYRDRVTLLSQVPPLTRLGTEPLRALAEHVHETRVPAGDSIVRQGERGDRFYLIVDGRAEVTIEDAGGARKVAELGPMDYFGERALIENAPRAATVRAQTKMRVLWLRAEDFRSSVRPYVAEDAALRARLEEFGQLDRFQLLDPLGSREKEILLARLLPARYPAGQTIINQDEVGDAFYLLRSGSVEVTRRDDSGEGVRLQTLGPGDFFGEIALLLDAPRVASVRALQDTDVWRLGKRDFTDLFSSYFKLDEHMAPVVRARLEEDQLVIVAESEALRQVVEGEAAPDFELSSLNGQKVSAATYRGRRILIWFSIGDAASGSDDYRAALQVLRPQFAGRNIDVLQIVPGSLDSASEIAPYGDHAFPILHDAQRVVYRAYGMFDQVNRPAPDEGSSWQDTMARLRREGEQRSVLAKIREGIVLVGPDGAIERIFRAESGTALPQPEKFLELDYS